MADVDHSSEDVSDDSQANFMIFGAYQTHFSIICDDFEGTSQDSKLEFTEDEETLIERMFNLLGERWSLIAGRIPGRTAEEIEKYWTSRYSSSE